MKIVVTLEVEDLSRWEQNFKTHGELFRRQTVDGRYDYAMIEEGNRAVLCGEIEDVDTFFEVLKSAEASAAVSQDGVKPESLQFFVLDRTFRF